MAKLFGFKIEKDDEQNKGVVSPVPQSNEDSSDYYVSSGFYGQYVDIDGAVSYTHLTLPTISDV